MLKNGVLAGTYRPISPQGAIKRRFNGVLATFTIWSILNGLEPVLGLGLRGIGRLARISHKKEKQRPSFMA